MDPQDDDARDDWPVVALGPSAEFRYSVGLSRPVFRIQGRSSTPLPRFEGYGVFSKSHQMVRRGEGALLAGWGDSLFVQKGGRVFRESVTTGQPKLLVELDDELDWAFAIPGTRNAVGIEYLGEGSSRIRLL